jgi:hypothetical protein
MNDVMVYYTECRQGKNKIYLAIQAKDEDTYKAMLADYLEDYPGIVVCGYELKTPKEYQNYVRGY